MMHRIAGAGSVVLAVMLSAKSSAQAPLVRVEFQLTETQYVRAFTLSERQRLEDAATSILVDSLAAHFRFLSFTKDRADSLRQLVITLDQFYGDSSAPTGEVGLHILLRNPPAHPVKKYWTQFRAAGEGRAGISDVDSFLAELKNVVKNWNLLIDGVLGTISIADTAVIVWGPPTTWLLPFTLEELCVDTDIGRVSVDNREIVDDGFRIRKIAAFVNETFNVPDSVRTKLGRYQDRIRARPEDPATAPATPGLQVLGLYMAAYDLDPGQCATLSRPSEGRGR